MAEISGSSITRPTFSGLSTGLDTSALLQGLLAVERRPLDLMLSRRDQLAERQGLFRELNSKLSALREAAREIDNQISTLSAESTSEELLAYKGSSSDEDTIAATATGDATPGQFEVRVSQLAQVGREISNPQLSDTSPTTADAGDTLTFSFANAGLEDFEELQDFTITVGAGGASLQNIRDAINLKTENAGNIRAEVLNDGIGNYRLVLSGARSGVDYAFSVTGTGKLAEGSFLDADQQQVAQNAIVTLFGASGIDVQSATNAVDQAIPGVTLNLRNLHAPGEFDTVSIELDEEGVESKVKNLVDAYNEVADFIEGQFQVDEETNRAGPLSNDFLLQSLQRSLQSIVGNVFLEPGDELTPYSTLPEIGVSFDRSSRLELDSEEFRNALRANPIGVRQLLRGDPSVTTDEDGNRSFLRTGFATRVASQLENVLQSGNGTLALRDDSYDRQIETLDTSMERFSARLAVREETLLLRFSRLESTVAVLQSQSSFFANLGVG